MNTIEPAIGAQHKASGFIRILDHLFLLRLPLLAPVWTILLLGWVTGRAGLWIEHASIQQVVLSGSFSHLWLFLVGFSLLVGSIYIVNQIADVESDRINGKLFLLPGRLVSIPAAWLMAAFCALGGILCSIPAGLPLVILFSASLFLGTLYNLPPTSLKNRPWGGLVANLIGHGILTYLVGWYVAHWSTGTPVEWAIGFRSSLAPGFANAAVFLATTIPDAEGDARVGKKTFCVIYGSKSTAIAAVILCTLAFAASFIMEHNFWIMALPAGISLLFFLWFLVAPQTKAAFSAFKWPVFLLTSVVALVVPAYGILIAITFWGSRWYYQYRFGLEYPTFKAR